MTYAHLNDSLNWKDTSGSIDLNNNGKLKNYISTMKKQNLALNKELQNSLQQRKKLQEKLTVCTNYIQTMKNTKKPPGRSSKKSLPGSLATATSDL